MVALAIAMLLQQQLTQDRVPSPEIIDGTGAPAVVVPRVDTEIVIDGVLDESAWDGAVRLGGFSQYEPVDGRPAEEETRVLVWTSPTAIHFGVIARDRQPGAIRATNADRDNIDSDDHILLYLDTFNDRRRAYLFGVNPLGVQQDGVRSEGASAPGRMFGGDIDTSPDFIWDSSGRVTEDGYLVEIRVPFKSLRYTAGEEQVWGFNVVRRVQRTGYTDTWTDVRRANASFLTQAGTLTGIRDLRRGVVVEAQPFLTATARGRRDIVDGGFERQDPDAEAGLNVRLGFTNFTLDGTVNPDFSQVESDAGQVTVNERFALFFPEKRPFFLEGIELFATPSQLVYTRQIVDPIGGAKLTGKLGPFAVAHLTMVDQDVDAQGREALFNITRLRRDFGSNSHAGLTFTDRSLLEGGEYNRVAAADVRIVFARLYYAEAQLGGAWTRDGLGTRSDALWKFDVDRTGRSWGFHYSLNGTGDEFVTRSGFVNRNGIVSARAFNRLTAYGGRGAWIESFTAFFGPGRIWRYDGFGRESAIEGDESVNLSLRMRGGWELGADIERAFVRFEPAEYEGITSNAIPYEPLDRVSGPAVSLSVNTPTYRRFDARAELARSRVAIFAEGSEGDAWVGSAGLAMRPTAWARINATGTVEHITRARDGSEYARSVIPRLHVEAQPSRAVLFRAIAEYRSERVAALEDARTGAPLLRDGMPVNVPDRNGLQLDLLAAWEPSPGTVAYLGYGSTLVGDRGTAVRHLERERDGFFFKLAYQFRW